MKLLEILQRLWIKRIDGFENPTYSQGHKDFDLFSIEGRLLRADVIKCWKIFHSKCGICPQDIFVLARSGITHGQRFKITRTFFLMDSMLRSFALRVASTWNSLSDDVVVLETLGSFERAIRCCLNEKLFHFIHLVLLRYFV